MGPMRDQAGLLSIMVQKKFVPMPYISKNDPQTLFSYLDTKLTELVPFAMPLCHGRWLPPRQHAPICWIFSTLSQNTHSLRLIQQFQTTNPRIQNLGGILAM